MKTDSIFIANNSKIGVLMLHGFSSTPSEFKELSSYLAAKGFTVSVPLIAGHGTSAQDMARTTPMDWANSVKKAYLELRQKADKIFIIGNSFGSDLGLWLVHQFSNEPIGVVTLGAPIFLKYHFLILVRLYTYGLIQKFYKKPSRIYKADFNDVQHEIAYPKIPTKSVRQFLRFIQFNVIPVLRYVRIPAMIVHSDTDSVIHPSSATFIYEHISSPVKRMFWYQGGTHHMISDKRHGPALFEKILEFMNDVIEEKF